MGNTEYWIWLSEALGESPIFLKLLDYYKSPENIYAALSRNKDESGLTRKMKAGKFSAFSLESAAEIAGRCEEKNYGIISFDSEDYPCELRKIKNPPPVLFTQGDTELLKNSFRLAIVGSRRAEQKSLEEAFLLSFALACFGASIVSGAAAGIDCAAHLGAVCAGGASVAVIGAGLDSLKAGRMAELYEKIHGRTLFVSEFQPSSAAAKYTYPRRDRIMSGLSCGTLVLSAAEKSGALITAEHAFSQGRPVFVRSQDKAQGSRGLAARGAEIFDSAKDITDYFHDIFHAEGGVYCSFPLESFPELFENALESLRKDSSDSPAVQKEKTPREKKEASQEYKAKPLKKKNLPAQLSDSAIRIYSVFGDKPLYPDEIKQLTQLPAAEITSALTQLELEDLIKLLPGNRFALL